MFGSCVCMSVCASVQLEMHSPENTNKITDVGALTCCTFLLLLLYMMEIMPVFTWESRPIHGMTRQRGASN